MLNRIITALIIFAAPIVHGQTLTCSPLPADAPSHTMTPKVTGVDNNNGSGVTRISFDLVSIPHTSSRIDSVSAVFDGHRILAEDIDGVDFKCYFQWEDDGVIPVEVDFKRQQHFLPTDSVTFHTVHGNYSVSLLHLVQH